MVALKLMNFGAMIPAVDPRLLPQNNAELSQNTWVHSGALAGMPRLVAVHTLNNSGAKKAFRIPIQNFGKDNIPDSYWIEMPSADVDIVASPLASDTFERYYYAGVGTVPSYNTKARIAAAQPAYRLGVPSPPTAPVVTPTGGTAPGDPGYIAEARAYVYTWVTTFGEEGPPSPPTLVTGASDATWGITVTAPDPSVLADRTLANVRIYRTITGSSGSTTYYYVGEIAIASTAYDDTALTVTVAGNNILQSTFWSEPPQDLEGLIAMPNGIIAGFRQNEVWFCEPYRPHAWPVSYVVAVESDIVGLGAIGQSLVVCTRISPYVVSGVNPASMSLSKVAANEPCLSRGSIVSTASGVVFASQNGLVLATPGMAQNATRALITKDLWLDATEYLNVSTLRAAALGNAYYCWGAAATGTFSADTFEPTAFLQEDFTGSRTGALIDISDPRIGWTKLVSDVPTENCWVDEWTGEILVIRDGIVYWLDFAPERERETFIWRSKVFETPNQRNFAAMRLYFDTPQVATSGTFSQGWWDDPEAWDDTLLWNDGSDFATVRVYADGVLRYERTLRTSGEIIRLPSGFKATFWQVEVESQIKIYSIEFATTAKELGSV